MTLTLMDWFCGAGGSSQGAHAVPGVDVTRAANHWERAIESHASNFPDTDHYRGDIREAPVHRWPATDIFWASPECFPAGTLILTRRGLVPVEEVQEGDEAFTHKRRWRPVVATMHRPADTMLVKGVGLAGGIETTSEHPFYTRSRTRVWDNSRRNYRYEITATSDWTAAKDLKGRLWATPIDFGEQLPVPEVTGRRVELGADFWWLVGRWLGDGSLRLAPKTGHGLPPQPRRTSQPAGSSCIVCGEPARVDARSTTGRVAPYCSDTCKNTNKRQDPNRGRYELTVVCGFHEAEELAKRLDVVGGLRWQRRDLRTAAAFTTAHRGLVEWIARHFGQHAYGKTIPAWALTMPKSWRSALLDGYLSADGSTGHYTAATTVSKQLAIGIRMLANSLGDVANVAGPYQRKAGRTIEGRPVNERPSWSVNWITGGPRHSFHADDEGYRWAPVREVSFTGRRVEVYNITVAEDESYVADGVTVHNCPQWSNARGKRRDFATSMQDGLFGEAASEEVERSRALMEEVPLYLRGVQERGGLVKAGVVENVVDVRAWDQWDRWIGEIRKLGYKTRVVAMNSMHANPPTVHRAPQSRDRLYVAYWHVSLRRDPDWDKWLRPAAWCPGCDRWVHAMQVFKKQGVDMGRYRQQYVYRCPSVSCRNAIVEPEVLPAAVAIDWSLPGQRIGDRPKPLADKTLARIQAGLDKFARPITLEAAGNTFERRPGVRTWPVDAPLTTQTTTATKALAYDPMIVPAGGTWRDEATSVAEPMPTRTTRENDGIAIPPFLVPLRSGRNRSIRADTDPLATVVADGSNHGLAVPPLLIPVEGRDGKEPASANAPMRTQTARNETGLAWLPFIAELRGGGSDARSVSEALATVTASGNHHGLVTPDVGAMVVRNNGSKGDGGEHCTPAGEPLRTLTTAGHQSLVVWEHLLVPYYGNGTARPVREPVGTLSTRDRYALVAGAVDINDVLFRMLEPHEIGRAMSFADRYIVLGNKRERVRQYGNAVTPNVAEILISALTEAITGVALEREPLAEVA